MADDNVDDGSRTDLLLWGLDEDDEDEDTPPPILIFFCRCGCRKRTW